MLPLEENREHSYFSLSSFYKTFAKLHLNKSARIMSSCRFYNFFKALISMNLLKYHGFFQFIQCTGISLTGTENIGNWDILGPLFISLEQRFVCGKKCYYMICMVRSIITELAVTVNSTKFYTVLVSFLSSLASH